MNSRNKQKASWRVIGMSAAGSKHMQKDIPCQDAFCFKILTDGTLIVSVSDGAGSALKAAEGSAFVSERSVAFLEETICGEKPSDPESWETAFHSAFEKTRNALKAMASESETPFHDYSATLISVVLRDTWLVGGMVGDCAAVALLKSGEMHSLCKPQKGEYANMTNFITHRNLMGILDIQIYRDSVECIALTTDGLAELALNIADNIPCRPFFLPLFNFAKAVQKGDETLAEEKMAIFLNSDRINSRTDDDKTLVIAVKIPSESI